MNILSKVDCAKTVTLSPQCKTKDDYVALRDASGKEFLPQAGTQMGIYAVRARCTVAAGGGIEVRAARFSDAGKADSKAFDFNAPQKPEWFLADEMSSNLRYDWKHPKAMVMGILPAGDSRLCPGLSTTLLPPGSTAIKCLPDEVMQGVDIATNTPVCIKMSKIVAPVTVSCPPGTFLIGISAGQPQCSTPPVIASPSPASTSSPAVTAMSWRLLQDCYGAAGDTSQCYKCQAITSTLCGTQWPNGNPCATPNALCLPDTGKCKVFKCAP